MKLNRIIRTKTNVNELKEKAAATAKKTKDFSIFIVISIRRKNKIIFFMVFV